MLDVKQTLIFKLFVTNLLLFFMCKLGLRFGKRLLREFNAEQKCGQMETSKSEAWVQIKWRDKVTEKGGIINE